MKSEKKILERYEKENNQYAIQISTNAFRELFDKYDRTSSFIKRDLDNDLAEYLFDSASDLERREFYVCLNLYAEQQSDALEEKVNKGIDSYFEYEAHKIEKKRRKVVRKIILHITLAVICFFLSYTLNKALTTDSFLYVLFVESIAIAVWVLLWPVFSDFIYELLEIKQTLRTYRKLINAKLKFNYLMKRGEIVK